MHGNRRRDDIAVIPWPYSVPDRIPRKPLFAYSNDLTDFDALIASIVTVTGFTVATRDTAPFDTAGVAVVNPFDEAE